MSARIEGASLPLADRGIGDASSVSAERWLMVLGFAVLVCARMPHILAQGRFWAEEGRIFFENAWTMPWYRALLVSFGGYLNLPANLAGVLARHSVPLLFAPYVSSGIGLIFQLCPAILLATARDRWISHPVALGAALLLVLTPPAGEEVWLSSIGSQSWLALSAALILALDPRGGAVGAFRLLLLVVASLSGPGAWALLPLFGARAVWERSWGRAAETAALAAGTVAQVLWFFHMEPGRSYGYTAPLLLSILCVRHLLVPLLGHDLAARVGLHVRAVLQAGRLPVLAMAAPGLGFLAFAVAITRARATPALWLFLAGGTLALIGYYGAIDGRENLLIVDFGGRYAFAPTVLFALSVLALAEFADGIFRAGALIVVVWLVVIGASGYFATRPWFRAGPSWSVEVARWQADRSHALAIWPHGWTMRLNRAR